jgi:hypothetical protein
MICLTPFCLQNNFEDIEEKGPVLKMASHSSTVYFINLVSRSVGSEDSLDFFTLVVYPALVSSSSFNKAPTVKYRRKSNVDKTSRLHGHHRFSTVENTQTTQYT